MSSATTRTGGGSCHWLVADVGGTNARFALVEPPGGSLMEHETLATAGGRTLVDLVRTYLARKGLDRVTHAAVAVAGPVIGDVCAMTNAELSFSIAETREQLGVEDFIVVNDVAAAARAVATMPASDIELVGPAHPRPHAPRAVVAPGTGLGIAAAIPNGNGWQIVAGEGGHAGLTALRDEELAVVRALRNEFGFASAEMALSGSGLCNLYKAMRPAADLDLELATRPEEVLRRALAGTDQACVASLRAFCELLAVTCANVALTFGATGGVVICGGLVRRFKHFLATSDFRRRFESHPVLADYLRSVATGLALVDEPGLAGAASLLRDRTSGRPVAIA